MSFKEKYLKYKKKYLYLKNQLGGNCKFCNGKHFDQDCHVRKQEAKIKFTKTEELVNSAKAASEKKYREEKEEKERILKEQKAKQLVKTEALVNEAKAYTEALKKDPHKWLEIIDGSRQMEWVDEQNKKCFEYVGNIKETINYKKTLDMMNAPDKIPYAHRRNNDDMLFNIWKDDKNPCGIWRKTTFESYKTDTPEWVTILDLDKLDPPKIGTAKTWVWKGAEFLNGDLDGGPWDRALVYLSPGGSDAKIVREFNLDTNTWFEGGFEILIPSKSGVSYRSRNELLVSDALNSENRTNSGYPRVIKLWKRGTSLEDAPLIFEGKKTDVIVSQYIDSHSTFNHEIRSVKETFYDDRRYYRKPTDLNRASDEEDTKFEEMPIPYDCTLSFFADCVRITISKDWTPEGHDKTFKAGTVLVTLVERLMQKDWSQIYVLFEPSKTIYFHSLNYTKDYYILHLLDDVKSVLIFWKYMGAGIWKKIDEEFRIPIGEDIIVGSFWKKTNKIWIYQDGFLSPMIVKLADIDKGFTNMDIIKKLPDRFNSKGLIVNQNFAVSKDGTPIPYFIIYHETLKYNKHNPTLIDGYGGFKISRLPAYDYTRGIQWLEQYGVYVIANIRGGKEYGPKWHQAALKSLRYKCYEDMEAIAQDLINKNITSPEKLAVIGASNGGLMVGNMLTRPIASKLFGAAICKVPLLDMKIYSHLLSGNSWMVEYGNPDIPEEWEYLRKYSPYHMLRHDILGISEFSSSKNKKPIIDWKCPKVLITTSTRDDRVHPAHARKFMQSLITEGKDKVPLALYYENTEGGHGGAANNSQIAFVNTLIYDFLWKVLK